jgi:hypothetical protein
LVLDIAFRDDESRVRVGDGAMNLAVLRHFALDLLCQERTTRGGLATKRLRAALDQDSLRTPSPDCTANLQLRCPAPPGCAGGDAGLPYAPRGGKTAARAGRSSWGGHCVGLLLVVVMFVGFGALFAGVGGASLVRDRRLNQRAARTSGVVVALERRTLAGGGALPFPVVEFVAVDGRRWRFRSDSASALSPFAVGQSVAVLYDPADPARARIDAAALQWALPVVFLALGGMFFLTGVCAFLAFLLLL